MADEQQGEKTEQATDARREEFRKQGQVANTRELSGAVLFLFAAGGIWIVGRFYFSSFQEIFVRTFGNDMVHSLRGGQPFEVLYFVAQKSFIMILPVVFVVAILGVLSTVMQTGILQVEDALSPDFNRINPLSGFKRIFSLRALVEGLKSIAKMILISVIMYLLLKSEISRIPYLVTSTPEQIVGYIAVVASKLLFGIGLTQVALAAGDYFFQRWDLERKMMMTKEEVKREVKQREGDPLIKSRIRRIQKEMSQRRMMDAIAKADVVITNPTHIAVVLRYSDNLPAPQLVAKGADFLAAKIREKAKEHGIPIVENKPLARTIYKTMKIGQVIPRELFVAVAEVLSYVYKLRKKKKKVNS